LIRQYRHYRAVFAEKPARGYFDFATPALSDTGGVLGMEMMLMD
jgi:hypothetical protein